MADIRFLSYPKFQAFDDNGAPLSGGEVEIFAAGTSTQITTWKDANKSAANTNPVSLNARGEADIWFDQSAKIILRDSSGTQIWSKDDISPLNAQTVTGKYNLVENGSFELDGDGDGDPDNWTISLFNSSTSTVEIDTSEVVDGVNSLKFVSQGDGGGTATSTRFSVPNGANIGVTFFIKSTKADVRNIVKVKYYDKNGSNTNTTTLYDDSSTNPTSWTQKVFTDTVPGSSTQAELILIGCDSSDSTSGTTYYDLAQVLSQSYVFTGSPGEVTADASDINNIDGLSVDLSGLTATATELNNLDGFTETTADLNRTATTEQWVHIETKTPSGASSVDFTDLDSTYDKYKIVVRGLETSDGKELLARYSSDNGSSFDSGSTDYGWAINIGSLADLDSDSDSKMQLTDAVASSFNRYGEIVLEFMGDGNASDSLGQPRLVSDLTSGKLRFLASGKRKSNVTANAVRLLVGTGTLTGTFLVYGWRDGS